MSIPVFNLSILTDLIFVKITNTEEFSGSDFTNFSVFEIQPEQPSPGKTRIYFNLLRFIGVFKFEIFSSNSEIVLVSIEQEAMIIINNPVDSIFLIIASLLKIYRKLSNLHLQLFSIVIILLSILQ